MKTGISICFGMILMTVSGCEILPLEEAPPVPVTSNYICAEGRSFNASFDPEGRRASVFIEGKRHLLYRIRNTKDPAVFTDGVLSLHAGRNPEPSIRLERAGLVIYRNCSQETGEPGL